VLEHHPVDSGGGLGKLAELLDVVVLAHEGGCGQLSVRGGGEPGVAQHVAGAVTLPRVLRTTFSSCSVPDLQPSLTWFHTVIKNSSFSHALTTAYAHAHIRLNNIPQRPLFGLLKRGLLDISTCR
jgi:hypothetical protein